jgi:2'-5' RNA ligase
MSDGSGMLLFALEPDGEFTDRVLQFKSHVSRLVGPQPYLAHPPHVTLYLAAFRDLQSVLVATQALAGAQPELVAASTGWHVFENDALTGNHTLAYTLQGQQSADLRGFQSRMVATVSAARDREACFRRYASHWDRLTTSERACIKACGFPWLEEQWHPHITVASVSRHDWQPVQEQLLSQAPLAIVHFPSLSVFRIDGDDHELVQRWRLQGTL